MANVLRESLVKLLRLRLAETFVHLDASFAQPGKAAAAHGRIRITHGGKDALDSRGDDGVGAGAGATHMRAGLEIEVKGRAARSFAGLLNGENLSVLLACVSMRSAADDLAIGSTSTAPTQGFGEACPMPSRASSRACCMNCSSVEEMLI